MANRGSPVVDVAKLKAEWRAHITPDSEVVLTDEYLKKVEMECSKCIDKLKETNAQYDPKKTKAFQLAMKSSTLHDACLVWQKYLLALIDLPSVFDPDQKPRSFPEFTPGWEDQLATVLGFFLYYRIEADLDELEVPHSIHELRTMYRLDMIKQITDYRNDPELVERPLTKPASTEKRKKR